MPRATKTRIEDAPVVPFAEFVRKVKAVVAGQEPAPDWAGKTVYATQSAKDAAIKTAKRKRHG